MKRNLMLHPPWLAVGSLAALGLLLADTKIVRKPIPNVPAGAGAEMYQTYCASCHGIDGKGQGPAAVAFKESVPDLTILAKKNNGQFPALDVMLTLGMNRGNGAHGSVEMPIWGDLFRASLPTEPVVQLRIYNLTRYIEQMQVASERAPKSAKTEANVREAHVRDFRDVRPSDGAAMYRAYCASCHGMSGTGDGPTAMKLKTPPSDLTMLARKRHGEYPSLMVGNVLGRTPGTPAHGSAEMPVWGDVFRSGYESTPTAELRIANLVAYVKQLQK